MKLLFFLLIFTSTLRLGYIFYRFNGILLLDIFLFLILILEINRYKQFKFIVPKVGILFLLFIAWTLFVSFNLDWMQANSFAEISKFVRAYLLFVVVYNFLLWKKDVRLFLDSLFITIFFHTLVSIYQWRVGPIGLTFLGEVQAYSYRSYGLFQHPNFLGDYLCLVIPILIRLFYFDKIKKHYYLYGAVLGSSVLSLFVTYARGAWLGLSIAVSIMLIIDVLSQNFRKIKSISLILTVLVFSVFSVKYLPKIQNRLFEDTQRQDSSVNIRIPLMKVAIKMIQDRPIIGVGFTNYELYSDDYATQIGVFSKKAMEQLVHNSYLLLASEMGVPGLLLYLCLIIIVLSIAVRNYFSKNNLIKNISVGILWGMIGVLLAFLTGPDYMIHEVLNLYWLLAGVVIALYKLNIKMVKLEILKKRKLNFAHLN